VVPDFRYSSATPDYCLHFHTVILLSVVYTLVPLPLALLELRTSAKQTSPPYKLQPRVRRTPADFIRCYKNTVSVVAPAAGALQLVSYPAVKVHTTSVLRWTSNNQLMSCRI